VWQCGWKGVRLEGNRSLGARSSSGCRAATAPELVDCGEAAWLGRCPIRTRSPFHHPCSEASKTVRGSPGPCHRIPELGKCDWTPNTSAPQDGLRENLIEVLLWTTELTGETGSRGVWCVVSALAPVAGACAYADLGACPDRRLDAAQRTPVPGVPTCGELGSSGGGTPAPPETSCDGIEILASWPRSSSCRAVLR